MELRFEWMLTAKFQGAVNDILEDSRFTGHALNWFPGNNCKASKHTNRGFVIRISPRISASKFIIYQSSFLSTCKRFYVWLVLPLDSCYRILRSLPGDCKPPPPPKSIIVWIFSTLVGRWIIWINNEINCKYLGSRLYIKINSNCFHSIINNFQFLWKFRRMVYL